MQEVERRKQDGKDGKDGKDAANVSCQEKEKYEIPKQNKKINHNSGTLLFRLLYSLFCLKALIPS